MSIYSAIVIALCATVGCVKEGSEKSSDGGRTDGGTGGHTTGSGGASTGGKRTDGADGGAATGSGGAATGSGGAGGANGGRAGGGGMPLDCTMKDDVIVVNVETLNDHDAGSQPITDGSFNQTAKGRFEGVVTEVEQGSFIVDTCAEADAAVCEGSRKRVTIDAPDLYLQWTLAEKALVHVEYTVDCFFGCRGSVLVTAVDEWQGRSNLHYPPVGNMYVAADEGSSEGSAGGQYTWESVLLDCKTQYSGGCGGTDMKAGLYAFKFDGDTIVTMGSSAIVPWSSGVLELHNVRSYVTGYCDDYWNFAHWAIPEQRGD